MAAGRLWQLGPEIPNDLRVLLTFNCKLYEVKLENGNFLLIIMPCLLP